MISVTLVTLPVLCKRNLESMIFSTNLLDVVTVQFLSHIKERTLKSKNNVVFIMDRNDFYPISVIIFRTFWIVEA